MNITFPPEIKESELNFKVWKIVITQTPAKSTRFAETGPCTYITYYGYKNKRLCVEPYSDLVKASEKIKSLALAYENR